LRIANIAGRAKLLVDGGQVDIESASNGYFDADPAALFERLDELRTFAGSVTHADEAWDPAAAGPPSPAPRQIFAIALNYADHAVETGVDAPSDPLVFAKYVTSLSGPITEVALPAGLVDWEVEVVAVVGATARNVSSSAGWNYVAGLTAGQDLSERQLQLSGPAPQFGLAKSFPGFSPIGPVLVSPEEFDRLDDLGLGCDINGEEVQKGRSSDMIFPIPELIAYLSRIVTLLPGDLIFTGTPPGVGMGRTPPRFLQEGDRLHSWIEGIGELEQTFTQAAPSND
jgi:2-keto-4-pentenoate hydratase/2-oxohepta-3-ene-1,7-dioic acid hydratase in catechol pathway